MPTSPPTAQLVRHAGQPLVGELAGVIDFEGVAITFNFEHGVRLGVRVGQPGAMEALPEVHDDGIGFRCAGLGGGEEVFFMEDQRMMGEGGQQAFGRANFDVGQGNVGGGDNGDETRWADGIDGGEERFDIQLSLGGQPANSPRGGD